MRAYPQGKALLRQTEKLLKSFGRFVDESREAGVDLSPLNAPEVSGVARTTVTILLGWESVRWLASAHAAHTEIDWEDYEDIAHLFAVWPRFLPLFDEETYVDTHTPFLKWLRAAKRKGESDLQWLVRQFESLPVQAKERAALFDPLRIWVRWRLADTRAARTHARLPARGKTFFHEDPFIERRDLSLESELSSPPLKTEKLTAREAARVLSVARDAMAVRVRELYGFSHPDARTVRRAEAGRGVEIYAWGVPPDGRFPVLAYLAAMVFKNGTPAAYAEALTLFERSEVGFNLFYTFREGESGWLYARTLRLFRQLHGVETFSVEPYQLGGSGNEEGIESGAFWFYRKLGFRPVADAPARLLVAEEKKIEARAKYRTSHATLRKLAEGHALYETARADAGAWDRFRFRRLGLAVQKLMSERYEGDAEDFRPASAKQVARSLSVDPSRWNEDERRALLNLSPALALIPDLSEWTKDEKRSLARIIRAKAGRDETRYARLLQRHSRLRRAIIEIGSVERASR